MKFSKINNLIKNNYGTYLDLINNYDFKSDGEYIGSYDKEDIQTKIMKDLIELKLIRIKIISNTEYVFLTIKGDDVLRKYNIANSKVCG